ncbi:NERD domain-containing protein [Methylocella tundrae]|uniref:NERD domain-containing protein n=1 Tax=Methylocella tundrae TaxID=227605 RepID=UPI00157B9EA1|nr:NERD domain-containing protein [Methylocella tundrae]
MVAAAVRQRKGHVSAADSGEVGGEVRNALGDKVDDLALAVDARPAAHHARPQGLNVPPTAANAVCLGLCYDVLMTTESTKTKIFIGAPIEHESERKLLSFIVSWLEEKKIPSIVLANIEIQGRQIDCIIATADSASVVEVKTSRLPIRGEVNGTWTRLSASGEWKDYTNAYQQAVGAKNSVRDAMQVAKSVGNFYPDGYVVFTSPIPEGSIVTPGNFKALVTTIDLFPGQLKTVGGSPWSLADWGAFACTLKLRPVILDQATAGQEVCEELDLLDSYAAAVAAEYGRDGKSWLPETDDQRADLMDAAAADTGCFISGPSGCGKSLMAKWLVASLAEAGHLTFFIAAKNFTGSWAECLRREVGLITDIAPAKLYRAVARSDRPVFLIVDGVNEFGAAAPEALRGVRALARRMGALLAVTGQDAKPAEFAGLGGVAVARPSLELKQRIARAVGGQLTPVALEVLRAVGSGIEAALVGQIGGDLKANATRLLLIDQYIRKRLAGHARAGSFGLRRLASSLHAQIAFSMAEANFDDFMRAEGLGFAECDALFAAGLLARRAGRVSFSHEMILNACAAFDLARTAESDPISFGQRLSTPILEPIAGDIVAAIDDAAVCRGVLSEVMSSTLLGEAARGHFGPIAASTTWDLLNEATEACVEEIGSARLALSKEGDAVRIGWEEATRREWTYPEEARLRAVGRLAVHGSGLDIFLRLCAEMDARLATERSRFADFAREERYPIRSQSFALTYYGFGESIGFTEVARSTQGGFEPTSKEERAFPIKVEQLTSGQLHFLLEWRRAFFDGNDSEFAEQLIYLFRERFRWEPCHVQLAMLSSIGYARRAPQEVLERLIEAIHALDVNPTNWAINASIVDALKILGALDVEAEDSRAQVKAELASVLVDDGDVVDNDLALSLCLRMFDHPFDSIYGQEIFNLDEGLRRRLYRRALRASNIKSSTSLDWLAREVASFGDPADVALLQSLTGLPSRTNPFAQEEWGAFATATRFVGRHHAELERVDPTTSEEACLVAIRFLIYAIEAKRSPDAEATRLAWARLHKMPVQLVVGCLSEIQKALSDRFIPSERVEAYPPLDFVAAYPPDCLAVSRRFIDDGIDAQFYHRVPHREDGMTLAFETVAIYGDRSDIERLQGRSRVHRFARHALAALKRLESGF